MGTISTLNEYIAFRTAHGINDYSYKDLYLGDYITINDGTYNAEWMIAHFDYFYRKGAGNPSESHPEYSMGTHGVVLIPRRPIAKNSAMNTENTTEGGYKASLAYTTHCPAIAAAMQTVFGSYLLKMCNYISNSVNDSIPSMAGAGRTGATVGTEWQTEYCTLPDEIEIYGTSIWASSAYDNFSYPQKLSVFNFISHVEYSGDSFWLRTVMSSTNFAHAYGNGLAASDSAASSGNWLGLRPLIYIG